MVLHICLVLAIALLVTGCNDNSRSASQPLASGVKTNFDAVTGLVESVSADLKSAKIAHDEIPGYMQAMSMTLPVQDANELRGIIPGDKITFRMVVTSDDGWIDQVKRAGQGALTNAAGIESDQPIQFLQAGSIIPDIALTNQFGKEFNLRDFRGKALAFTFIFTRCPFPIYCPRLNNNFTEVQSQLAAIPAATNWHLLSISFDPKNDTPNVLENYARRYKYNPEHWTFAVGPEDRIRRFGASFGLNFMTKNGAIDHNVRTVVVDGSGKVLKIFPNNEWKPQEVVDVMKEAMRAK